MRTFVFTEQDLVVLRHERFHHPHPRVQLKMEVLWLKSQGLPHADIARLAGVSRRSVQRFLDDYLRGGLEALRRLNFHRPQSRLDQHRTSLEEYFVEHPPRTSREAQQAIEQLTGIRRGLTQVRTFLKKSWGWPGGRWAASRPRRTPTSRPRSSRASCNPG